MKTIITTLLFFSLLLSPVRAQVEIEDIDEQAGSIEETSTNAQFTAELIRDIQDPGDKTARYIMRLETQIDASRVRVTWTLRGGSVFTETYPSEGVLSVEAGETYDLPVEIRPTPSRTTELVGTAEAIRVDGNLIATVRTNFATNENAEILPLTDEYLSARQQYQITSTLQNVIIGIVVVSALGFGFIRFRKYLNRDDVAAFDRKNRR